MKINIDLYSSTVGLQLVLKCKRLSNGFYQVTRNHKGPTFEDPKNIVDTYFRTGAPEPIKVPNEFNFSSRLRYSLK